MAIITVNANDIDKALTTLRRLGAGMRFYETISKFSTLEDGESKEKTVQLLVAARDCAEAQTITQSELTPQCHQSSVDVISCKVSKYSEAHHGEDDYNVPEIGDSPKWYGVKINYIVTPLKGKPKKNAAHYLFYAGSVQNANAVTNVFMLSTVADYEVASISETKIEDVIYPSDNE